MAAIDLRSATIFIKDGSVFLTPLSGTVNHTGGYPVGTKTLLVSVTGAIPIGTIIHFGSHLQYYTVVAKAGSTTSITIFPPLQAAVTNGSALSEIGTAVYAKIGEGNLTYNEKRNLVYIRDRGFIDTVKLGDDEPMEVSIDFTWEFLRGTSTTVPTFEEAFKQIGQAATWVSTAVDTCAPYCVDIVILDVPPCGTDAEKITLPEFRWETMDHDMKGAKVAVKGTCNVLLAIVEHTTP